jgi:hypothetical protein
MQFLDWPLFCAFSGAIKIALPACSDRPGGIRVSAAIRGIPIVQVFNRAQIGWRALYVAFRQHHLTLAVVTLARLLPKAPEPSLNLS